MDKTDVGLTSETDLTLSKHFVCHLGGGREEKTGLVFCGSSSTHNRCFVLFFAFFGRVLAGLLFYLHNIGTFLFFFLSFSLLHTHPGQGYSVRKRIQDAKKQRSEIREEDKSDR